VRVTREKKPIYLHVFIDWRQHFIQFTVVHDQTFWSDFLDQIWSSTAGIYCSKVLPSCDHWFICKSPVRRGDLAVIIDPFKNVVLWVQWWRHWRKRDDLRWTDKCDSHGWPPPLNTSMMSNEEKVSSNLCHWFIGRVYNSALVRILHWRKGMLKGNVICVKLANQ
jgi:hypothetical protein